MNDRPIKTGIASYGMSGMVFHAPLLSAHPSFDLAAIVQRHDDTAKQKYPHIDHHTSFEAMLADQSIELVVVNTPNALRKQMVSEALRQGKHVVVEKPFTNTVAEGEALIELAENENRVLTVFQNRRWDGDFLTIQELLEQQAVGRLVEFEAHYDRYRDYIEEDTWKEEPGPGDGILYNLGSHMIDQALVLFGQPLEVEAWLARQRTGSRIDDAYQITLFYESHKALIKSSYLVKDPGPRYRLLGEKGTFTKYGIDPQEDSLKAGQLPGSTGWGEESPESYGRLVTHREGLEWEGAIKTLSGNYLKFYDSVFSAIREGKPPAVTGQEGLQVIEIIEACKQSNEKKKRISIA